MCGIGGTVPLIFNLCIRWRSVVRFTPRLFYPLVNFPGTNWIGRWVGRRVGLNVLEETQIWSICPESNHDFSIAQPLLYPLWRCGRYTDTSAYFRTLDTDFNRTWIFFILINPVVFFCITNDGSTPPNTTLCHIILCYMSQFARTVIRHFWLQQFEKHKCVLACYHVLIWHRITWHRSVVLDGVLRLFVTHGSCGLENILTEER
jgi:hypothetical protein